jgi:aspartyl-tRNA(Asn)/glutamyl-tRNA(Gln) amidotransferase subunit A
MSISNLRQKFIEGSYTPLDAYNEMHEVIERDNCDLNAFLDVYDREEEAKRATEQYEKEGKKAPALLGMPIAIKENILVKGERATAGSKILENYIAPYDATIIARLKKAGALFVGGTNLDEFAMGSSTENSAFGPTKNPFDQTRVPGGSSGGSSAALAMGAAAAAYGTETGGSVRLPAAFCGLVGHKPTYGSVSRFGIIALASSLDQAGSFTQTAEDAELLFKTVSGQDPNDATTILPDTYPKVEIKDTYTIGIPRDFLKEGVDEDVMARFETHASELEKQGHKIVDVSIPLMKAGLAAYYIIVPAEASSNLAKYDGMRYGLRVEGDNLLDEYMKTREEGFGAEPKRRILLGTYVLSSGYYDAYYGKAEQVRELMRKELNKAFSEVDLIMTPTSPTPAFKLGEKADPLSMYLADIFTAPANLTGSPAISLPMGTVEREGIDLPVGVQYIGPHAGDYRLFDIGKKSYDSVKGST